MVHRLMRYGLERVGRSPLTTVEIGIGCIVGMIVFVGMGRTEDGELLGTDPIPRR